MYALSFFLILVTSSYCLVGEVDNCNKAKNCQDCMGSDPICSWCYDEEFYDATHGAGYRCANVEALIKRGCSKDKIQSMKSSEKASSPDDDDKNLQLMPSWKQVSVRPGDLYESEFIFRSKKDSPVDLYFLIDLSYTMKTRLTTVSKLTKDIVNEMRNVTKDLLMGFGAFVDKPVFPFVAPSNEERQNPCPRANDIKCDPTFLFKHILDLTSNYDEFQNATQNIRPSGNLDSPEGGLDALLQVAHCPERIGWRKNARKIVLFATDGPFHLAGDGRLAGLIKPPPTTCQLTLKEDNLDPSIKYYGWYTANETDYPSVGEITQVLTNTGISVIFATTPTLEQLYSKLASFLPSAGVGTLQDKAGNIVSLLRDNYDKIVNKTDVKIDYDRDALEVTLLTKCHGAEKYVEKSVCEHPVGGTINYKVVVKPKKCFEGEKELLIRMLGLQDSSTLKVKSACDCPRCDAIKWEARNDNFSPKCSSKGNLICGACKCNIGSSGEFCECSDKQTSGGEAKLIAECTKENFKEPCSGRGRCTCGTCKCNMARYQGKFCDCDKHGCKRASDDNKVCGGDKRGECRCDGTCKCNNGYTGEACDCLTSEEKCIDPNNPSAPKCSGNGICDCGHCFCHQGFTGKLCNEIQGGKSAFCTDRAVESCVTCIHSEQLNPDGTRKKLSENEEFDGQFTSNGNSEVSNQMTETGFLVHPDIGEKCSSLCANTSINPMKVNFVPEIKQNDGSNLCIIYSKDNCRLMFTYKYPDVMYKNRNVTLSLMVKKECTSTKKILSIVLGVIGAIVLGGLLLLLLYKLVITIDDRKTYAQVVKDLDNTRWEMTVNPTYTQPSTTVLNPTFNNGYE